MESVTFRVKEVHGGFSEAAGMIYVDGDDLVLEVETKLLSLFRRPPKVYRFELVDLDAVRYKKGFRHDRLTLRTRPLDAIADVPGVSEGELCLLVARKDRDALDRLLDRLDLWRAD
ncbi:MAG: hypothetical protein R3181_08755 [Rubricoccaceae bacterium]|nr:hypothetical protein [Rubricoccaceae bacterium]